MILCYKRKGTNWIGQLGVTQFIKTTTWNYEKPGEKSFPIISVKMKKEHYDQKASILIINGKSRISSPKFLSWRLRISFSSLSLSHSHTHTHTHTNTHYRHTISKSYYIGRFPHFGGNFCLCYPQSLCDLCLQTLGIFKDLQIRFSTLRPHPGNDSS